jgi:hypothetical protein
MKIGQQAGGGGNEPLPEWHEMPLGHRDYLFISCKSSVKVLFQKKKGSVKALDCFTFTARCWGSVDKMVCRVELKTKCKSKV